MLNNIVDNIEQCGQHNNTIYKDSKISSSSCGTGSMILGQLKLLEMTS